MKHFNIEKSKKIAPIKIIIIGFIFVAIGFAIHLKMKKSDRVSALKQASSSFALLDTSAIDKIIFLKLLSVFITLITYISILFNQY